MLVSYLTAWLADTLTDWLCINVRARAKDNCTSRSIIRHRADCACYVDGTRLTTVVVVVRTKARIYTWSPEQNTCEAVFETAKQLKRNILRLAD